MIPELDRYCARWSADLEKIPDGRGRIDYFRQVLPDLLLDRACAGRILETMVRGGSWPDLRAAGLFDQEVLLYLDPGRRFSLRLYFHPAGKYTAIHDHTSWGVSGTPAGRLSIISYDLAEKGEGLKVRRRVVLDPGQIEITRPLDDGIHRTGSPDERPNTMISIYGPPGRRLYLRVFDADSGRFEKRFPARILRRMLARQALAAF